MDHRKEAVVYYKRLCKALLTKPDRAAVQRSLTDFVKTKSFGTLATDLPRILNTPRKRALVPAIRALIPDSYHVQFDRALQHIGTSAWTTVDKKDAARIREQRQQHEEEMIREARRMGNLNMGQDFEDFLAHQRQLARGAPEHDYQAIGEWGFMEDASTVSSLEFTEEDEKIYADVEELADEPLPVVPPRYNQVVIKAQPVSSSSSQPHVQIDGHSVNNGDSPLLPAVPPRRSISNPTTPKATTPRTTRPASPRQGQWLPEWYNAGPLTRQEAETELRRYGFTDGLFLVRDKGPGGVKYCLSVVSRGSVRHVLLDRESYREPFLIDGKNYGNCYSPEDMVEKIRDLGERFEYTLVRPFKMPNAH